jgi:RecA-family ATPase
VPVFLFADARTRIAPGGTNKTTLALFEAVKLSLGQPIWGREPVGPLRTVLVTREDSREILVGRLRKLMDELVLNTAQRQRALDNIAILDFTGCSFRLSAVENDVVVPNYGNLDVLKEILYDWKPDWLICDPLVSFGVGESRVNDAEQGLIEAFRMLRNELDCCVEGIHHTGKAVSRDKILDQYAGRGGSALADGCRMVAVMQPLSAAEWLKATGKPLHDNQQGLVMALPKMSYCAPQPPIYILREGFRFTHLDGLGCRDLPALSETFANRVYDFLASEYAQARRYCKTALEEKAKDLAMNRKDVRDACTHLMTCGRVIYHEVRGRPGAHFEPLDFGGSADEPVLT